ncbi:major facilitator superfamily domain-containing protein 6-like protein A isoform X1 [Drosophila miranda]|uniref:major facilitator superfamily domain-containing protein 6-like protein A isoform X1 n=1 Tax=Drosophila miranda TaxID=7229 RepID=UPI0007E79F2B|nr:major facilitator superfamily domain-containing protein 6-like protein A isoform X1 [Drosophila miranda]
MKPNIDKELLPMKAHYFLFNAGTAPVVPFMPTLAHQLGYSPVVVGTMYMILPIIGMLAKPLFGYLADRYHRHRLLFLCGQVITGIAFFLIMFVPAIDKPLPEVQFHCHAGVSSIRHCSEHGACVEKNMESFYGNRTLACDLECDAQPYMWDIVCEDWLKNQTENCAANRTNPQLDFGTSINMKDVVEEGDCLFFMVPQDHGVVAGQSVPLYCPAGKQYFNASCRMDCHDDYLKEQLSESPVIDTQSAMAQPQFWFFFGMLIMSWIGMAVVVSIGDAICFGILGDRHHLYGKQRLCGSLGWGIFALLAGVLVDHMSVDNVNKNYTAVFWMALVIMGFDVLASSKLKVTQTHLSSNIVKDVGQMFLSLRCVIFFLWCVAIGFGTALIWNFLLMYLEILDKQFMGCGTSIKTLQGLVMAIQCFGGELPFFFLSGWILKRIGHVNAMSLVLFGFGVRFILYSMLQNPWYILPIELLNGVTFGLFYATMASYASIVAPPGTEATMQSLVGAIFEGVGVSMGSLIGGILFNADPRTTFEIFGIAAFIIFVIHVSVQMFLQRNGSTDENGKGRVSSGSASASSSSEAAKPKDTEARSIKKDNDGFSDVDLS